MAEDSRIAWTRSTFNPWIGCTGVSPGCDNCYAEAFDKRHKWGGSTHWGPGVPRHRTSTSNWAKPLAWNKAAPESEFAGRKGFWPVFCASLADVFDNEVPDEWRADLMKLIVDTPRLSWLLVTKRIGNVARMIEEAGDLIDYGEGWQSMWGQGTWPDNVRLMITVVNQEEADRDIPKLLALPCKNGVSYEPALGQVDWREFLPRFMPSGIEYGHGYGRTDVGRVARGLDWIIAGGESGPDARAPVPSWFRSTRDQCRDAGVAFFFKQWGEWQPHVRADGLSSLPMTRVGKRAAGRTLDGREHSEFPT